MPAVVAAVLLVVGLVNVALAVRFHVLWHVLLGSILVFGAVAMMIVAVRESHTRRTAARAWRSPSEELHAGRR